MGFFDSIKKAYNKVTSTIGGAINTVTKAIAPKVATQPVKQPTMTYKAPPAPTQQQLNQGLPAVIKKTGFAPPATTSTQQTSPGNPIKGVSQPPSQVLQTEMTGVNPNTSAGVGTSKNNLQTLTIQPGQTEQVATGTFDPEVEAAIRETTGNIAAAALPFPGGSGMTLKGLTTLGYAGAKSGALGAIKLAMPKLEAGAIKIGTDGLAKWGFEVEMGTAATIATNTATQTATKSLFSKLWKPAAIGAILSAFGTYPWADHLKVDNAIGTLTIAKRDALMSDIPLEQFDALFAEADIQMQDILNPQGWNGFFAAIPFGNVLKTARDIQEGTILANQIYDIIAKYKKVELENLALGIAPQNAYNMSLELQRQEKAEQEQAQTDYYNNQRMLLLQWEEEAKDRDMQEDADFYAAQKERMYELEAQEREETAKFWLTYKKLLLQLQEDKTPSNLKFGLL